MAWLSVAGETLRAVRNEWRRLPDEVQGELARMADFSLGSTQRNPKRVYEGTVLWLTTAAADAFRAAISVAGAPGVATEVSAVSDATGLLGGETIQVYATLGTGEAVWYRDNGTATIYWKYSLRLTEA